MAMSASPAFTTRPCTGTLERRFAAGCRNRHARKTDTHLSSLPLIPVTHVLETFHLVFTINLLGEDPLPPNTYNRTAFSLLSRAAKLLASYRNPGGPEFIRL